MSNFTDISTRYRQTSSLQESAAGPLFELLDIRREDDVLDLGCGPGHLTRTIRGMTGGRVMGIDPAPGMITEAQRSRAYGIEFQVGTAESLDATAEFHAIFCNSVFQWFRDAERALANCYNALRPGGRMAIQAPARRDYCPSFVRATESLLHDARTRDAFAHFRSPWLFLETADEYATLFGNAGFHVVSSSIEQVTRHCSPGKVMEMFDSGATAGYLNPECYETALPPGFIETARELISRDFQSQAQADSLVELTFFRIYLLAAKPTRQEAASSSSSG